MLATRLLRVEYNGWLIGTPDKVLVRNVRSRDAEWARGAAGARSRVDVCEECGGKR